MNDETSRNLFILVFYVPVPVRVCFMVFCILLCTFLTIRHFYIMRFFTIFTPPKQGSQRYSTTCHTSLTDQIGLILAHMLTQVSLGRVVPSILCVYA